MRRLVRVPETVQATPKWSKLTVLDGFIIIAGAAFGFFLKWLVHPTLALPFVALFPISLYFLLLPSESPGKKVYQLIMVVITKDRKTYHALDVNDKHKFTEE